MSPDDALNPAPAPASVTHLAALAALDHTDDAHTYTPVDTALDALLAGGDHA